MHLCLCPDVWHYNCVVLTVLFNLLHDWNKGWRRRLLTGRARRRSSSGTFNIITTHLANNLNSNFPTCRQSNVHWSVCSLLEVKRWWRWSRATTFISCITSAFFFSLYFWRFNLQNHKSGDYLLRLIHRTKSCCKCHKLVFSLVDYSL